MKRIWIYYLPFLFLPNLGFETVTPFGILTVSDYFIGPYLILVFLRNQPTGSDRYKPMNRRYVDYLIPTFLAFIWWAFISTLLINFRYDYQNLNPIYIGLLKLGKLSLYGLSAIFTIQALSKVDEDEYHTFLWAILASGLLVGITLLISNNSLEHLLPQMLQTGQYQVFQENPISAMLSIMITFLVGMILGENGSDLWRFTTIIVLGIMILGSVLAEGRGGWVAMFVGITYISVHVNFKQTLRLLLIGSILLAFAYYQYPSFKKNVVRTINPDPEYLNLYNAGIFGLDDGARLVTLINELPKIQDTPLLGRGFFHRGGLSGIYSTGSHNFFLQMFLETGIPGGLLILLVVRQIWRHASSIQSKDNKLDLPIKAATTAAIISGLSGEYFYGGMVLFTLLLVYAPVGRLKVDYAFNKKIQMLQYPPSQSMDNI